MGGSHSSRNFSSFASAEGSLAPEVRRTYTYNLSIPGHQSLKKNRDRSRLSVRVTNFMRKINTIKKDKEVAGDEYRPKLPEQISAKNPLWAAYASSDKVDANGIEHSMSRGESIDRVASIDSIDSVSTYSTVMATPPPPPRPSPMPEAPEAALDSRTGAGENNNFINFISQLGGTSEEKLEKQESMFIPTPPTSPPPSTQSRAWDYDPISFRSRDKVDDINNYYFSTLKQSPEQHTRAAVDMIMATLNQSIVPFDTFTPQDEATRNAVEDFVSQVQARYTDTSYHGFHHAVDVMQMMYLLINNFLKTKLNSSDPFILLVICLCHDVGHQGANNAFIRLSSEKNQKSILEQFHIDTTMEIVGNSKLFSSEFIKLNVLKRLKILAQELIIATDMENHDAVMKQYIEDVKRRRKEKLDKHKSKIFRTWSASRSKNLVTKRKSENMPVSYLALAVKLCDIANVIRDFDDAREWAKLLSIEFEAMGTIENKNPGALSKQQKLCKEPNIESLSKLTLGFMGGFAVPMARSFEAVSKSASEFILTEMLLNMQTWLALVQSNSDR
mmetsp:Transcript_10646/g.12206  ORF Transcript_10646/g.12206 Transcript_10646/m.12206 type:complete len:557 (+) Transcript_10646:188-1858(+)